MLQHPVRPIRLLNVKLPVTFYTGGGGGGGPQAFVFLRRLYSIETLYSVKRN